MEKINPISFNIKEDDINEVIDEKQGGNSFIALRKVSWNERPHKLELRKWVVDSNGDERPMKGFSFFNEEEGPNNLVNTLLKVGYGDTNEVLQELKQREDFADALENIDNYVSPSSDIDYYDPSEMMI